jgi:hypothetical protein
MLHFGSVQTHTICVRVLIEQGRRNVAYRRSLFGFEFSGSEILISLYTMLAEVIRALVPVTGILHVHSSNVAFSTCFRDRCFLSVTQRNARIMANLSVCTVHGSVIMCV